MIYLFALLFPVVGFAEPALTLFSLRNPLPEDAALECRVMDSPKSGYILLRQGNTRTVRIISITDNKPDNEQLYGTIIGDPIKHLFIRATRRIDNSNHYLDIHVKPKLNGRTLTHGGVFSTYIGKTEKDSAGVEREALVPTSGAAISCRRR